MRSRSVGMCIVLSLVTCGLYTLYWLYSLAEDMDHLTGGHSGGSGGMVLLLTIITCGLYGWYWLYRCGDALDQLRYSQGERARLSGNFVSAAGDFQPRDHFLRADAGRTELLCGLLSKHD